MRKSHLMKYVLALLIAMASLPITSQTRLVKGNLKVVVTNFKNNSGQAAFFLFNAGDAFPNHTEKSLLSGYIKIAGNSAEYTFTNIDMGTYAVYVFHDEDKNKALKTNFLGMPKEGIGVSNHAKGHFGPPKYDDAKFNFNKPAQTISISLSYL